MTTLEIYIEERLENQIIKIDSNNTNIEIFLNKGSIIFRFSKTNKLKKSFNLLNSIKF